MELRENRVFTESELQNLARFQLCYYNLIQRTRKRALLVDKTEQLYNYLVKSIQQWLVLQSQRLLDCIKDLIHIKLDDIKEAKDYATHFRSQFANLCKNYKLDNLDCQQEVVFEGISEFRKEEFGFFQSFCKQSSLPLSTKRYEAACFTHAELDLSNQNLQLYEKSGQKLSDPILIPRLIGEVTYLNQEFGKIAAHLKEWE